MNASGVKICLDIRVITMQMGMKPFTECESPKQQKAAPDELEGRTRGRRVVAR
ncbi:hypothetical protein [Paenibacillus flagellatus]|uniref:hypothetical protein n=1 Tax=Paenibacillus flagellatus TaxID=2211139 RepID=UPI001305176A|nr:hypothetical protein [Paenibacillus flagellatus]